MYCEGRPSVSPSLFFILSCCHKFKGRGGAYQDFEGVFSLPFKVYVSHIASHNVGCFLMLSVWDKEALLNE